MRFLKLVSGLVVASFLTWHFVFAVQAIAPTVVMIIEPVALIEYPTVQLTSIKGTREETLNAAIAVQMLNQVYASQCFEYHVITRNFTETNGLNNQEIFNQLRAGIRKVSLIFYTGSWTENHIFQVIGYVRSNIPDTIFQNRFFVQTADDMARNLIHEVAHLAGFMHFEFLPTSVPYQMNEIWDECKESLY